MVPFVEFPPVTPFTCQVTDVLVVPCTVAVNVFFAPAFMEAVTGETEIVTAANAETLAEQAKSRRPAPISSCRSVAFKMWPFTSALVPLNRRPRARLTSSCLSISLDSNRKEFLPQESLPRNQDEDQVRLKEDNVCVVTDTSKARQDIHACQCLILVQYPCRPTLKPKGPL